MNDHLESTETLADIGELALIQRLKPFCAKGAIGDDAALTPLTPNHQLVTTTDMLTDGVHFSDRTTPPLHHRLASHRRQPLRPRRHGSHPPPPSPSPSASPATPPGPGSNPYTEASPLASPPTAAKSSAATCANPPNAPSPSPPLAKSSLTRP